MCVWVNVGVELEFNFYKLQNLIENCFEKIFTSGSETPSLSQALSVSISFLLTTSFCIFWVRVCCSSDCGQFVERVFVYCNLTDLFGNPGSLAELSVPCLSSWQVNSEA